MNPTYFQVHAPEASRSNEAWIEVDEHLDCKMIRSVTEELRAFSEKGVILTWPHYSPLYLLTNLKCSHRSCLMRKRGPLLVMST